MRLISSTRIGFVLLLTVAVCTNVLITVPSVLGKDFIVVIGGGFSRESNQASLEANLIFVQEILAEQTKPGTRSFFYFADGNDTFEDLQIVAPKPDFEHELIRLLKGIHRQDNQEIAYRNHRVPQVAGRSSPENVKDCLAKIASEATSGDRVIVYVTAHGGSGPRRSPYNTTVMGWDRSSFSVSEFAKWLSAIPNEVPCIAIMAQCYCGGFADAIFDDGDAKNGLTNRLQIGFFAQQHNLPAAGCRPDIENDEEFSSYFWGAMVGKSRIGSPFQEVDANDDGVVSFSEAYAFTVIASRTIDIPLRSSDRLLRVYSSLDPRSNKKNDSDLSSAIDVSNDDDEKNASPSRNSLTKNASLVTGPISELLRDCNPTTKRIAIALMKQLAVPEDSQMSDVYRLQDELNTPDRNASSRGRIRSRSGRRQILSLIGDRWEKLADREQWQSYVAQLPPEECDAILQDIQNLEGFGDYQKNREETLARVEKSQSRELQQVAFTRLIHHLELAVLEKNLPNCASPDIQARYKAMVELENQGL